MQLPLYFFGDTHFKSSQSNQEKAKVENQIQTGADTKALAEYFTTIIQGMALRAKDGAKKSDLAATSEITLKTISSLMI